MNKTLPTTHADFHAFIARVSFGMALTALSLSLCAVAAEPRRKDISSAPKTGAGTNHNTLAASEKSAGWKLLFDGQTTKGWRGFRRADFPVDCWQVEDGLLKRKGKTRDECGDIITLEQYDNFQLELEWLITPGGNSGVKYLVPEERPSSWEQAYMDHYVAELKGRNPPDYKAIASLTPAKWKHFAMGFELQLIDDEGNADARKAPTRLTGGLYDLIAPSQEVSQLPGKFNQARVVVRGNHVEHWINGVKCVEFERGSPKFKSLIADSKFKHLEGFGSMTRGHIALQDHGDEAWFRNIKIRELRGQRE